MFPDFGIFLCCVWDLGQVGRTCKMDSLTGVLGKREAQWGTIMGKRQQAAMDDVGKGHRVSVGWRVTARIEDLL